MHLNVFLFVNLIILSFSLKELSETKKYLYRAMTELDPPLETDACLFQREEMIKNVKYDVYYVKPCQEGFHCGNTFNKIISTCIPNLFGQKVGEKCNYDEECLLGECDKTCKYKKAQPDEYSYSYRCAEGLVYDYINEKCVENKNFLEGYCRYTKKGEKEVYIEPNKPFYVCGEAGYATKDQTDFELNSPYIKLTKVGKLKLGETTNVEFACESGAVSKIEGSDFWMCDRIKEMKTGVENNINYVEYKFEKAGTKKYTQDEYEDYFFYDELTGKIDAYGNKYDDAFSEYKKRVKKYEKKCVEKSQDYYFRALDCGIKEIAEAVFYLFKTNYFSTKDENVKMIRDYFLGQDYTTRTVSSETLSFKKSIFIIIAIFALL